MLVGVVEEQRLPFGPVPDLVVDPDAARIGGLRNEGRGEEHPDHDADGRLVAFYSFAANLVVGDRNGEGDVFVRDRQTGATERVSVDTGGGDPDDFSTVSSISADGRLVAFYSFAANLVAGDDRSGGSDIFVRDLDSG